MTKINFTKFTKPHPGIMTKDIKLGDGQIVKDGSHCWLSNGTAETVTIPFNELGELLDSVAMNQAVCWGVCKHKKIKIVSQAKEKLNSDAISRTAKNFTFPKGQPGIMMIDNDTGMSTADLLTIIEKVIPEFCGIGRVERPSCSSDIYDATGKRLTTEGTGRIYYPVDDASQIPRTGKILHQRLILAGYGNIFVSKSGSMLVRSLVDADVFQSESLDFVGPPVLGDGLERRAPKSKYVKGSLLVTADVKDLTNEETTRLEKIIDGLKAQAQPEADKVRSEYIGREADKLAKDQQISKADAKAVIQQRAAGNLVNGDVLHFDELGTVSAADVLADPKRFHKQTMADPLEPDYGGGRCKAMLFVNDDCVIINSMAHGGRTYTVGVHKTVTSESPIPEWPTLDAKAFKGFAGDFVRLATRNSEADHAAVLITFLTRFGVEVGCGKTMAVGDTKHKSILASVIVGSSSKARKGTSAKPAERLFSFPETLFDAFSWPVARSSKGPFSSGEGIIFAIRDKVLKWDAKEQTYVVVDPGVDDKRLFVLDEEFGGVLANTKREGNTLSMIIRQCWDGGTLDPLTKNNKIRATNGVVGWVSHITLTELNAKLPESESFNGFANRILWCLARRQKLVPIPQPMPREELEDLQIKLLNILKAAECEDLITLSSEAADAWCNRYYADLTKDRPGLAGCTTNRGEAQALRLAMVYCLLDGGRVISIDHLESGIAVWEYCRQSANYIFAGRQEDATSQRIIESLEQAPMTRTKLHKLFQNNVGKDKIQTSLKELLAARRIEEFKDTGTGGAPSLTYRIIKKPDEFNEDNEITPINEIRQDSKFVNSLISSGSNRKTAGAEGQLVVNGEIWEVTGCDC